MNFKANPSTELRPPTWNIQTKGLVENSDEGLALKFR